MNIVSENATKGKSLLQKARADALLQIVNGTYFRGRLELDRSLQGYGFTRAEVQRAAEDLAESGRAELESIGGTVVLMCYDTSEDAL